MKQKTPFCFKYFSNDGKAINQFNIKREQFRRVAISDIAQKRYFFGKNEIEKAIGPLENTFKAIIDEIKIKEKIPLVNSREMLYLLLFATVFHTQNLKSKDKVNEATDEIIDIKLKEYLESEGINKEITDWKVTYDGGFPMAQIGGMHGYSLILDLKIKLIKNNKGTPFITSDNPVVLYNLSMIKEMEFSRTGLQSPGLMIFIPIGENICLLFYDSEVYKLPDKEIIETEETDIDQINKLQLLNANHNIFFENCSNDYIKSIFEQVKDDISKNDVLLVKKKIDLNQKNLRNFVNETLMSNISERVLFTSLSIRTEMEFSFIEKINYPSSDKFSRNKTVVKFFEFTVNADLYEGMVNNKIIEELKNTPIINSLKNHIEFKVNSTKNSKNLFIIFPKSLQKENLSKLLIKCKLIPFRSNQKFAVKLNFQIKKNLKKSNKLIIEENFRFSDIEEFILYLSFKLEVFVVFRTDTKPKYGIDFLKLIENFDYIASNYILENNLLSKFGLIV